MTTTQSSSGGSERASGRIVMASRPRAKLAASLLPAWWRALASTAWRIGAPFQWSTSTSGTNVGWPRLAATFDTTNCSPPSSTYRSIRNGRNAVRAWNGIGNR